MTDARVSSRWVRRVSASLPPRRSFVPFSAELLYASEMRARIRAPVLVTVVVLLLAPVGGAVAAADASALGASADAGAGGTAAVTQQDDVTLTVAVETADGDPVDDAEITASWENGSASATTASNGRALLDVPAGVAVELSVDHPDYMRNDVYTVEEAAERTVELTVRERGGLTVQVEDDRGDPVRNAQVVLRESGAVVVSGRTNADGSFSTGAVEQRDYSLSVVKEGYYRSSDEVTVGEATRRTTSIERGSVTVSFVVTDDRFDPPEPVSGAQITLETAGSFTTLQDGEATAQVPVNADLDLELAKEGYETVTRTLEVGESATTVELSISRTPELNVSTTSNRMLVGERTVVTVVDAYGDPVADATVRVDGQAAGTTGGDGTLAIRFEEPGEHAVVAETDGRTSGELTIRAVEERTPTATPTASPTPTATATERTTTEPTTGVSFPGFTPVTVLLALVAFAGLAVRRAGRSGK